MPSLKEARAAAGAAYAEALQKLVATYIELAALDRVAGSRMMDVRTFHGFSTHTDPWLCHPEFAPERLALMDPIAVRAEALAKEF